MNKPIVTKIDKIGEKDNNYWLQCGKESYSGFKEYEGERNLDYGQLLEGNHNQPFKVGDTILLTYKEKPGIDKKTGESKIYKNIVSIFPFDGATEPQTPKTATPAQKTAPSFTQAPTNEYKQEYTESREAYGRRLAIHGLINGMLASGVKPSEISMEVIMSVDSLEDRINEFLTKGTVSADDIGF